MRIALLEVDPENRSATGVRGRALASFLRAEGHAVEILSPPAGAVARAFGWEYSLAARLRRRLRRERWLRHPWEYLADEFEALVRPLSRFDALVGRGQAASHVFTRIQGPLKLLDMANIDHLELYYGGVVDLGQVERTYEREMEVFEAADRILCHHEVLTRFLADRLSDRPELAWKLLTVRMGCSPAARRARYDAAPRIVYAGSAMYIQDPFLLASLARTSPFPLECYGPSDPNRSFLPSRLAYRGYAPDLSFLADYQVGLITVSRDLLRRNSPSTKFADYFAHGLPVLFPEWMREGHEYAGCAAPYTEETYRDVAQAVAGCPATWQAMSERALEVSREVAWDHVLRPLADLLRRGGEG